MTVPIASPVLERPLRHEALFPEEVRRNVYDFLHLPGWETGWKSNNKRDAYSFLHKHFAGHRKPGVEPYDCEVELQNTAPIIHDAWFRVKEKIFSGHKLVRCYANGMAYGMDGTVHSDATAPGNYTAVYYPHERWSPNWGGEAEQRGGVRRPHAASCQRRDAQLYRDADYLDVQNRDARWTTSTGSS
jgi:hypothetical protein